MSKIVEVLDGLMGSGKTTKILEWIDNNPNERFLFVSPLLSEVEEGGRVTSSVNSVTFECPSVSEHETKSDHLFKLLENGVNIACTHSLYLAVKDEHLNLIEKMGYILIIDEEVNVVDVIDGYSRDDYRWLYENDKIVVSDTDGMISWVCTTDVGEDNKYFKFKNLCDYQALYVTKRDSCMMVTHLPIKLMTASKRVIVLTYMFEGNMLHKFLQLKGVETAKFSEVTLNEVNGDEIRSLINLLPLDKKVSQLSLSSTWYEDANEDQLKTVSRYISNVARKHCNDFTDLMYTLPKKRHISLRGNVNVVKPTKFYRKKINGEWSYNWIPVQMRATNDYRHKSVVIHCQNRFPLVAVSSYLSDYNCAIDVKVFALSEMVQWIWRSRIRENKPIVLAIANKRMYNLFKNWLEEI